ncbi:hypothetical protein [Georgenia thermotolerans]|uniref:Uncharacterized protein n=1 Tax=Georgenia thermotolerans TaxID=527326 RepID=A0A7J5UKQ4_9MICO|nr:hypothetical protein [Georgenia thermotolerans]KAE8762968.1 hypothetical protein GB883_16590 [Georgenia thermotolerans]
MRALLRERERGAATLEHLGTVVIVVLLFGGAVLGFATYGPRLQQQLCVLASAVGVAGPCEGTPVAQPEESGPTDADFLPAVCTIRESTTQTNAKITIAFLEIGQDAGFIVQENADGTVQVTVTDGASLGASGGFGASLGGKDSGIGGDVSFGAGLSFKNGSQWNFASMDDWTAMEKDLKAYLIQQKQLQGEGAVGMHLYLLLTDGYLDKPQEPEQTSWTQAIEISGNGKIGLRDTIPGKDGAEPQDIDPNLGVYVDGKLADEYVVTENHKTGETSRTYSFTASGEAGGNLVVGNASAWGEQKGAYKITENKDGEVISIEFMAERAGGSKAGLGVQPVTDQGGSAGMTDAANTRTVVTTTIEVTDANRHIVEDWVTAADSNASFGLPVPVPANSQRPDSPVADDAFANLLYQEGRTSERVYDNVEEGWSFGAEFALGIKLGASFGSEEKTATIQDASFLGAPGQDGVRPMVPESACTVD